MASNSLSLRRGQLSRPGVCTPPPPPPILNDDYAWSLVFYYASIDYHTLKLHLTAKSNDLPQTALASWSFVISAESYTPSKLSYPPDAILIEAFVPIDEDLLTLHATLILPPADPATYSAFFSLPPQT